MKKLVMARRFFSKAEPASGCRYAHILRHRKWIHIVGAAMFVLTGTDIHADVNGNTTIDSTNFSDVYNADTLQLLSVLTEKLENEIKFPTSNAKKVSSYLTNSQAAVRKMIFDLAALGDVYSDSILLKSNVDTSRAGSALKIALGLKKDERVHSSLRKIVLNETDPNLRAMAVTALFEYKDTLDIDIFIQALSDTNKAYFETDFGYPGKFVMLVGMNAVGALHEFGYCVTPDSLGGYRVEKRER